MSLESDLAALFDAIEAVQADVPANSSLNSDCKRLKESLRYHMKGNNVLYTGNQAHELP